MRPRDCDWFFEPASSAGNMGRCEMELSNDRAAIIARLAADPLENVVLLKHLTAYPEATRALSAAEGGENATLVLLDAAASPYDRATYPEADVVAFLASDSEVLSGHLLRHVPLGGGAVFKLAREADRAALAGMLATTRTTAFHSFTAAVAHERDPSVRVTRQPRNDDYALLAMQGHDRAVLEPLLVAGDAFVCALDDPGSGATAAVCCAFVNHGPVHEVGGVFTRPDRRGQGLAPRVVTTALAVLRENGHSARYNVEETNPASLRLAARLGLRHFLTLTHHTAPKATIVV